MQHSWLESRLQYPFFSNFSRCCWSYSLCGDERASPWHNVQSTQMSGSIVWLGITTAVCASDAPTKFTQTAVALSVHPLSASIYSQSPSGLSRVHLDVTVALLLSLEKIEKRPAIAWPPGFLLWLFETWAKVIRRRAERVAEEMDRKRTIILW